MNPHVQAGDLSPGAVCVSRLGSRTFTYTVDRVIPGPHGVVTVYFGPEPDAFHWTLPTQVGIEVEIVPNETRYTHRLALTVLVDMSADGNRYVDGTTLLDAPPPLPGVNVYLEFGTGDEARGVLAGLEITET